jgi:hypothetical protein
MQLHASNPSEVANPGTLNVPVSGPGPVSTLMIFTGTAVMEIGPVEEGLPTISTPLSVVLFDGPFPGTLVKTSAYMTLASIRAVGGTDPNNQSQFELIDVRALIDSGLLQLEADLLTGTDSVLLRVNYQVFVTAHLVG